MWYNNKNGLGMDKEAALMYEGISLRVPAKESALTVVRLPTAGAAAQGC